MATALDVVSLEAAKEWLRLDNDFCMDDGLITSLIESSVATIEQRTGLQLYKRVDDEEMDFDVPEPLKLAVKMLITNDYEDRAVDEKYSDSDIKAKTDPFRRFTWF